MDVQNILSQIGLIGGSGSGGPSAGARREMPTGGIRSLVSSASAQGALGGAASGALVNLLMNKKARKKLGKSALKVGGIAAVAGVGYHAWKSMRGNRDAAPPATSGVAGATVPTQALESGRPADELPLPIPTLTPELELKLILAMVGAAAADGNIDFDEIGPISKAIDEAPLTSVQKAMLTASMDDPPSVEQLAELPENEEEAYEIYSAAVSAIEVDTAAESVFLTRLGRALRIDSELATKIERQVA